MTDGEQTSRALMALPIITFIFVPGCFTITYLISVLKNDLHPVLPMISETGEKLPQNFIFATIVNLGAFTGTLNYIARYYVLLRWGRQKPCLSDRRRHKFDAINRMALCVALAGVCGALIVGNVEASNQLYLHNCGAILVVVMSMAYCWMQAYLTYCSPLVRWPIHMRTGLCIVITVAFVTGAMSVPYAHAIPSMEEHEALNVSHARFMNYRWLSDKHEYFHALLFYHFTEWLIVVCTGIFLLSFVAEFRHVRIVIPPLYFSVTPGHGRQPCEMLDVRRVSGPCTSATTMKLLSTETHMTSLDTPEDTFKQFAEKLCESPLPSELHGVAKQHQRQRSQGTTIRIVAEGIDVNESAEPVAASTPDAVARV